MVRNARLGDYEQVEKIMQQIQHMHVEWRPDVYCNVETVCPQAHFENLVRNGEIILYTEQDIVIGVAIFNERIILGGGVKAARKTLFVDTMAVLEGHRGKGVGHALFEELKVVAKQKACAGIELQVNAKNEKAMKMYKDYGFTEKSINMEINF